MNNLIKYIIKNHKITDIKDDIIKILFIYNYRYNKKLKWFNIIWTKFPTFVENYLIECYINESIYDLFNHKDLLRLYEKDIKETISDLNNNTFIKFLYDNDYLCENFLISLSKITETEYSMYGNIVIFSNLITKNDIEKVKLLDKNNYINLGVFIDKKIKPFGIYYKEIVKINGINWIILTGYKELVFDEKESIKIISWIFSKVL